VESTPEQLTVQEVIDLKKSNMLVSNPEYQRGSVWALDQKKRLVDSLLRSYPLPLIYLHRLHTVVAGMTRDGLDVIDGQQRINSLYEFSEGAFRLFDPSKDAAEARFPSFLLSQPCPWGGETFESLTPELRQQFLDTKLSVVYIDTKVPNEARDLFIRLQAGLPLNPQEKRDAWPGKFTDFVLRIGGKPEIARYPGHDFFTVAMKTKANTRGEVRQLAAQMIMLFVSRANTGKLCDTKRDAIDDFYYQNLDFDIGSPLAKRFEKILDILTNALRDGKRKKIQGHEAIGLVLLVDSLLDGYTQSWQPKLAAAFDSFRQSLALGSKSRWDAQPDEYWTRYGILARTNSDRAETIEKRHAFFTAKLYGSLQPQPLDPNRIFGPLEREIIYYRDGKLCQVPNCLSDVAWADSEIHHVQMHSKGGKTVLVNGALVHKSCHPRSTEAVAAFAQHWEAKTS
jgi:hypothetical protein